MPTPTADTTPRVQRAPGRKKTVGQKYVETLGADELARAAESVASIRGLVDASRIADLGGVSASVSAASKAFGASSAASDLFRQFAGIKSMTEQYSKLSAVSGIAKQTSLISEAVRAAGMIDAVGLSAKHSAALAGLAAVPRVDPGLLAASKAFGASSAASDLFKQFAGMDDLVDPSALLRRATSALPALGNTIDRRITFVGDELVLPGSADDWEQRESGLWTRITPETYWAVLVTALFVSVCVGTYLSEMNRIGAPLSDTNRMSLALEVAGLLGLAKSVDAATRWLYRLITGENLNDDGDVT
ncbi:MAG: hypothetical protein NTV23_06175 [Propionibacteriales bacterium]|nr:hypothetical protein [Propionibacteriales bacterium]